MNKIIVALVILGVVGGMYFSSQESNTNNVQVPDQISSISYPGTQVTVPDHPIPDITIGTEKQPSYCYHCNNTGLCSDCNGTGKIQQRKNAINLIGGQDTSYTIDVRCYLCGGDGKCIRCR